MPLKFKLFLLFIPYKMTTTTRFFNEAKEKLNDLKDRKETKEKQLFALKSVKRETKKD